MGISTFDIVHNVITGTRLLFAPYFLVYGMVLICTFHLQQAYGTRLAGYGIAYLIISFNEFLSTTVGYFGVRKHNKALLFIHLVLDLSFAILQQGCGAGLLKMIKPTVPYETQYDCVKNVPSIYSASVCNAYLTSDRTMGFRLAWYSYYTQSIQSPINYQILYQVQNKHGCCGFGPPLRCTVDTRDLPSQFPTYALANSFKKQRQMCGIGDWYEASSTCNKVVDYDAAVWVYGGCEYDHPVGGCAKQEVQGVSHGCIPHFEQRMASKIKPHAKILLINNSFKYVALLMALLVWLRRKDHDGIPRIFVTPEPPPYFIYRIMDKLRGGERQLDDVSAITGAGVPPSSSSAGGSNKSEEAKAADGAA